MKNIQKSEENIRLNFVLRASNLNIYDV